MILNELLNITKREGIFLRYTDLKRTPGKLLGLYFVAPDRGPIIVLEESLKSDDAAHAAILAEELGHHFTKPTSSILSSSELELFRDERKALSWAVKFLSGALMPAKPAEVSA